MANLPHWDDEWEDWDTVILGSHRLPGVWTPERGDVKRVYDLKKSPGRDGALVKDEGYENGQIRLIGQFISADDWRAMQRVADEIHPKRKGKAREPLAIQHPALAFLSIFEVKVTGVSVPQLDNGVMTVEIEVVEYVKEPKKAKKPAEIVVSSVTAGAFAAQRAETRQPPDMVSEYPGIAGPLEFEAPE